MNKVLDILETVLRHRWAFDLFFDTVKTVREKLLANAPNPRIINAADAHESTAS